MDITIGTDLIKLVGPSFNDLESLKVENLTRNHIINYRNLKKELNEQNLIIAQIFSDIFIFRTDKNLSVSKMIKMVEEGLLKKEVIADFSYREYKIQHEVLQFDNRFTLANFIIPYILKEMFLNGLAVNLKENLIIDYRNNKIIVKKQKYGFNGFIFRFEIDEKFNVYLKIDAIFPSDFNELKIIGNLPKSKERKGDNDKILKFLKDLELFCGGKTYSINPNFLNFKKRIIERDC